MRSETDDELRSRIEWARNSPVNCSLKGDALDLLAGRYGIKRNMRREPGDPWACRECGKPNEFQPGPFTCWECRNG